MRRGRDRDMAHAGTEREQSQTVFGASHPYPSYFQPHHTPPTQSDSQRDRNTMYQHTNAGVSLSQSVDNHLREIRTMSFFNKDGRDLKNHSHFESYPPHQRRPENSDSVQNSSSRQFHSQQPPSGPPNSSVPFPPLPPPRFNPSVAPPGLAPFHQPPPPPVVSSGISSQMFHTPPPLPPQQNMSAHSNIGMPSHIINAGTAAAVPNNIRTPLPQNNFRMPPPPNSVGAIPPSYNLNAAPPLNPFMPPPPFPNQLPSSNPAFSQNSQSANAFSIGQNSFPAMQETPISKPAREELDSGKSDVQKEVDRWLQSRGKKRGGGESNTGNSHKSDGTVAAEMGAVSREKKQNKMSIGEAQNKLHDALHALAAVQGELQQLEELQGTADANTLEASISKIKQLKETYMKTKQKLDVEQLKSLKRKLDLRRKKRERQKRHRQEEKEVEQQVLFERAQKHVAIDQWQERLRQEHLNQQEMKRMKETADKTLSKVRREIRETRKMLDTVSRLQKLRAVRNDTAEKRGQTFPPSVAEHFTEKTGDLTELLTQQLQAFEKEEAALKLILETENEEAKEKKKEEKREKEKELRQREMEEEQCSLFGEPVMSYPGDPMQPFVHYYLQAHYSLQALQNIRQEWDTFLVADSTPMASRIPDGWVSPEPPSSKVWASALQSKPSS